MKFTCESCSAQYMISDEKVGPSGVKVRCKKCGNVILVRRGVTAPAGAPAAAAPPPETAAAPASGAAAPPAAGLEAELGQAFDHAFGDGPSPSSAAPAAAPADAPGPAPGGDMAATQLMGSEDAAKVFADKPAISAATEWYVAIGQAQVGPLPLAEVKKKWEAGDVGPDSLVWRPGMADWAPLTTVSELAGYLAPVPRAAARTAEPRPDPQPRAEAPAAAAAEASWKPMGAAALAALANEEIAARAPEPRAASRPAEGGVKSLVDGLPDGGGVDPTGALPLNIKALEANTQERKLERRSSVARDVAEARRRSTARAVFIGVAIGVVVVAGAAVGGVVLYRRLVPTSAPIVAARPSPSAASVPLPPPPAMAAAPAPSAAPPAEAPPTQPASVATATAPAAAATAPPAATTAAAPAERAAAAEPAPAKRPERHAASGSRRTPKPSAKPARAEPPPRQESPRVASAEAAPPPAPAKRKGGGLLDFESNDKALDDALGSSSGTSGRSVYVPPARTGGGALPDKVSPGEINAAVAARIDSLRRCVSEQKSREPDASGTLKMRWIIQGDGSAADVKCLTSQYAQGAFAQCIAGVVKGIKFPRSSTAGQEVTFPFNF